MPRDAYFSGHGKEVWASMVRQYGRREAERVFYATANKRKKRLRRKKP